MSLQTRRPPGHGKRKALTYTADILRLRGAGHSLAAIREALEDAGVLVSISTVRREVLKGTLTAAARHSSVVEAAAALPFGRMEGRPLRRVNGSGEAPHLDLTAALPGKAIAEEFMRGRPTNSLYLTERPT